MAIDYSPHEIAPYNPADLENMVRYCVQELMNRRAFPLRDLSAFEGPGIYALFYDGDFPLYQHAAIRSPDATKPIYVGRARQTKSKRNRQLFDRLGEHKRSIEHAENLDIDHFRFRFLVLHPLWVSTVEDLLIGYYRTLWNDVIEGFGVHDPGGKRHEGDIPMWDVLHPGRPHREKMRNKGASAMPLTVITGLIARYCQAGAEAASLPSFEATAAVLEEASIEEDDRVAVERATDD